eukprot:4115671-Prorocentrum_lima.AAC.1
MQTTYVNRANTNKKVLHRASAALSQGSRQGEVTVKPLSTIYKERKRRWLAKIVQLPEEDIRRSSVFLPGGLVVRPRLWRRSGRPRH